MLDAAIKFFEEQKEILETKLGEMVLEAAVNQIKDWEERFPDYEFQIRLHDLGDVFYRLRSTPDDTWQEVCQMTPHRHEDTDIFTVAVEADKFTGDYCYLDARIVAPNYGWVNNKGEV